MGAVTPRGVEWVLSDGEVALRAFKPEDEPTLLAGRDDEWRRWLGPGHEHPQPTACIVVGQQVVGWVDSDPDLDRLRPGETNLGYNVFAARRGSGYATRAVRLMLRRLGADGMHTTATLEIHVGNTPSLRVAEKTGFIRSGETADGHLFSRRIG